MWFPLCKPISHAWKTTATEKETDRWIVTWIWCGQRCDQSGRSVRQKQRSQESSDGESENETQKCLVGYYASNGKKDRTRDETARLQKDLEKAIKKKSQNVPSLITMVRRRRQVKRRKRRRKVTQKGGAPYRRKPTLVDKIAEGAAMFLSGPSPSFARVGTKLVGQAFKGIKDNVQHYRRRRR